VDNVFVVPLIIIAPGLGFISDLNGEIVDSSDARMHCKLSQKETVEQLNHAHCFAVQAESILIKENSSF
jgi:hypothetical protein